MRRLPVLFSLLAFLAAPVSAQSDAVPPPVPDARPPAMAPVDDTAVPEVTITRREGSTVAEHRINGRLYKVTVTPDDGIPYTLVDQNGDGHFSPENATQGSSGMAVPMWVIGTF